MTACHLSFAASASTGRANHTPAAVEQTATASQGRKKMILRQNVLALSTDLAQASAILANQADEIVNFASTLQDNCGREEAAARISAFIESLYPASSSLHSRRSFGSGLAEMIANGIGLNRFPWRLALTTTVLLGWAAILFAK